jgi:hypothetical protein
LGRSQFSFGGGGGAKEGKNAKIVNGLLFNYKEGGIGVSSDGVNFLPTCGFEEGPAGGQISDIAYGNGKYVAVGWGGEIWVSSGPDPDTLNWNWEQYVLDDPDSVNVYCIIYANGYFVVGCSSGAIQRSLDGMTWETVLNRDDGTFFFDIDSGNGKLVIVGVYEATGTLDPVIGIMRGASGTGWTPGDRYLVGPYAYWDFTGHEGEIAEWTGSYWNFDAPSPGDKVLVENEDVVYVYIGPSSYESFGWYLAPAPPMVYTSVDTATWTEQTADSETPESNGWTRIVFTGDFFVTTGPPMITELISPLQMSVDGETWEDISDKLVSPCYHVTAPMYGGEVEELIGAPLLVYRGKLLFGGMFGDLQIAELTSTSVGDFTRYPFINMIAFGSITAFNGNLQFHFGYEGSAMHTDAGFITP